MKVPNAVHQSHPWVIERIAPDFKLLDVWALPIEGHRDEVESFLESFLSVDLTEAGSAASRFLFRVRLRLGAWFGWDDHDEERPIPGCSETSLSDRLPDDLRGSASEPAITGALARVAGGFVPLYRTGDEWAAEISNATVHGVMHLAKIDRGEGRCGVHMGVYVKPRGLHGEVYMKLIEPFRQLIVYPALMRHIARAWEAHEAGERAGDAERKRIT